MFVVVCDRAEEVVGCFVVGTVVLELISAYWDSRKDYQGWRVWKRLICIWEGWGNREDTKLVLGGTMLWKGV